MRSLLQDLRYGLRMLAKNPGFTAVAVLTLALGIGANTATFSVVNAVLLRPLPYQHPERLVMVWETYPAIPKLQAAVADFLDWQKQNRVFDQIGAYTCPGCWEGAHAILTGAGEPAELQGTLASADLFPLLGVKPFWGRGFRPEEDNPGNGPVVLLSHSLWQSRFSSDPRIIGRAITLSGKDYTVVGVMPPGFKFPAWADVWLPLGLVNPREFTNRKHHLLDVIARLKSGVTPEQAQVELATIAGRLEQQYPATNRSVGVELIRLQEELVGNLRFALLLLMGTIALVLLIACANVANLLLARATTRAKEIAIRTALGAGRARVIRQLLAESLLLSIIGGLFGLLIAFWGLNLLRAMSPNDIPRYGAINLDDRVLIFTLLISVLTGIIFGLAPALQASKIDLSEPLKERGQRSVAGAGHRFRGFLVVSEVALSLLVLTCTGLLVRTFRQLLKVDLGFNPQNVLTMQIALPESKYTGSKRTAAFSYRQLLSRIDALPGVKLAATTNILPLTSDLNRTRFLVEGVVAPEPGKYSVCQTRTVSLDYLRVMQVSLLKGRFFTEADSGKPVIIINETMARRFFPRQDPVGKQIIMGVLDPNPTKIPIIGVVADSRDIHPYADAEPEIYWLGHDNPDYLVVRTVHEPLALASAVRSAVFAVDKDQPVYEVRTMDEIFLDSLSSRRYSALLLTIFSAFALLLAAVGIYGVTSYTVTERTHEIGIRMALGAKQTDVLKMVVRQGMKPAVAGVAIGIAGALALTRFLSSLLYGVRPTDPLTFIAVSLILTGVALFASYIPARRATKVDPMVALRYE